MLAVTRSVRLALALVALVIGCGDDGATSRDGDGGDAETGAPVDAAPTETTSTETTASETSVDDAADASDAPEVSDPTFALACSGSESCLVGCARGVCLEGRCRFDGPHPTATGCVVEVDAERGTCVDRGAAREDAPACFFCSPSVSAQGYRNLAFADGFEEGGAQIAVERLVATPATWVITDARAATGEHSLYFGDPVARTYDVGERGAAVARTSPLYVPAGARLTLAFQLWADTEQTDGFDRLRVLVEDEAGSRALWTSDAIGGTTHGVFQPVTIVVGAVAPGARLAFEADTIDGIINRFEGFYLDDVRIATTCCDPAASAAGDCDDNDPCTVDGCAPDGASATGGACTHTPIPGCCLSDASCEDGNACTADRCSAPGGTCSSEPIPDCCASALECDDQDPCTEDRCDGIACAHAPLCCERDVDCDDGDPCTGGRCHQGQCRYTATCCRADEDCDDGAACTDDRCDDGTCVNAFTYAPGCCIPDVLTERFDSGLASPAGWTLSPIVNNVGWQVLASGEARSDPAVLYYGHRTLGFYENGGRNTGTAATPFVRLPEGVQLALTFALLADVEQGGARDVLEVQAIVGAEVVTLVTKDDLAIGQWQEIELDLSFAAGELVQIRWTFDTVDGVANTKRGLFLDDVRILSSCLPVAAP
ncbi:MAG: hypothetical protein IT385_31020 [Deltaproteobacteria bacterium]|nr:hypothetical protein [Deltaproteobacteria bacterium]